MELVEGETLASRLERGRLPLEHALAIAEQIASALERAHRQGIVHRDLKPANVMIVRGGAAATPHVKLLDFDSHGSWTAAVSFTSSVDVTRAPQAPMTGAGTILGTLNYMSPEQVEGKEADHRADIFALGALLYEMLTGHRAFSGESPASTMAAILERQPAPARPGRSSPQRGSISSFAGRSPRTRTSAGSASDIATCLREMPGVMSTAAASPPRSSNRLRRSLVALAAVARRCGGHVVIDPALLRSVIAAAGAPDIADRSGDGSRKDARAGVPRPVAGWRYGGIRRHGRRPAFDLRPASRSIGSHRRPQYDGGRGPFFSPDGRWLAYHTAGPSGGLIKVLLATGTATTICPLKDQIRGAVWASMARSSSGPIRARSIASR